MWRTKVERILQGAPFVQHLGIRATDLAPGACDTELVVTPSLLQHDGYVHAGVITTLADHTAGAAAGTLVPADHTVLSVEFKVHLLRAATGERLTCQARVVKPGAMFCIVQSDVFDARGKLTSRLLGTMASVPLQR